MSTGPASRAGVLTSASPSGCGASPRHSAILTAPVAQSAERPPYTREAPDGCTVAGSNPPWGTNRSRSPSVGTRSPRHGVEGVDSAGASPAASTILHGVEATADRQPACGPVDHVIQDYTRFAAQERGLSSLTLSGYVPVIRRFLSEKLRPDTPLQPRDVNGFLLDQIPLVSRERAHVLTAALRGFLRYAHERGLLEKDLSGCIPVVARRRDANLPRFLEPPEVEALLRCQLPGSPCARRDHAALLLMARLGLRAGEVVQLTLDDLNWEAGEILIRGKSAHDHRLPLPPDAGRALADYLRRERPRCSSRYVFLRALAPHRRLAGPAAVSWIVRRALACAGIQSEHKGAHLLRHSLATRMLRGGASLAQIGRVLRHQQPRTTELYAKVDVASLRALAQPWPGGAQ